MTVLNPNTLLLSGDTVIGNSVLHGRLVSVMLQEFVSLCIFERSRKASITIETCVYSHTTIKYLAKKLLHILSECTISKEVFLKTFHLSAPMHSYQEMWHESVSVS